VVRDPAEDHCHYTMTDDNVNLWQCSACGEEWVFDSGDPEENNVNYCMRCGRKLTRDAAAAALKEQEAKK
jgi:DNA-directed RNA polymerase subunit RPC12/RpoP